MLQIDRTLQETTTSLAPADVLDAAKRFFARRNGVYTAFLDREGPTFVSLRGQGTEEIVVAVAPAERGTRVTASTYLFDQQVARFFTTLPTVDGTVPTAVKELPESARPAQPAQSAGATS